MGNSNSIRETIAGFIMVAFALIAVIAVGGVIFAWPLKWCWNYTMPAIFGLPVITWGQAWCLNFIAGCLIKSTHTHKSN